MSKKIKEKLQEFIGWLEYDKPFISHAIALTIMGKKIRNNVTVQLHPHLRTIRTAHIAGLCTRRPAYPNLKHI